MHHMRAVTMGGLLLAGCLTGCNQMESGQQQLQTACLALSEATTEQCNCFVSGLANQYGDKDLKNIAWYLREQSQADNMADATERANAYDRIASQMSQIYGYQLANTLKEDVGKNLKGCDVSGVRSKTMNRLMNEK